MGDALAVQVTAWPRNGRLQGPKPLLLLADLATHSVPAGPHTQQLPAERLPGHRHHPCAFPWTTPQQAKSQPKAAQLEQFEMAGA